MPGAYERLIPPFRSLVDRLLADTEGEGWAVRRAYLASIYDALDRGRDERPALDPEASLSAIIAAVIERAGAPAIAEVMQAGIYAASAEPAHRAASAAWFDLHPDQFALIRQEMAGGRTLH